MKILITGGTGFVGSVLCQRMLAEGYSLLVLTRNTTNAKRKLGGAINYINSLKEIDSTTQIQGIINLAGESIGDKRWSAQRKKILESSRVDLTADLIALIKELDTKPEFLISGSAIGYYGDCGDKVLTEFSEPHDEYSHRLCAAWEAQALRAKVEGVRVCIIRTGLVVGKNGGFLKKMLPSFKLGFGAKLADGNQYMSWIHMDDLIEIIMFLINDTQQNGIYNATAPNPVPNKMFTKLLAAVLKRPTFLVLPKSMLELMFGEMAHLLITGQRVVPAHLEKVGFEFKYKALKPALEDVLN